MCSKECVQLGQICLNDNVQTSTYNAKKRLVKLSSIFLTSYKSTSFDIYFLSHIQKGWTMFSFTLTFIVFRAQQTF